MDNDYFKWLGKLTIKSCLNLIVYCIIAGSIVGIIATLFVTQGCPSYEVRRIK